MTGLADDLRAEARGIRLGYACWDAGLLERAAEALAPRPGLTRRQYDTMLFIQRAFDETGVMPSFDEIAAALGLKSKAGVQRLVVGLEERGYLRRVAYKARALTVLMRVSDHSASRAPGPVPRGGAAHA